MEPDTIMLWAASVLCFFGFFQAGEITVPTLTSFDPSQHLGWGDVAIDSTQSPQTLRVRLQRSKTDQLGKGVDVFVGKTGDSLCPVAGVLAYMAVCGLAKGPFFQFHDGQPLTKPRFTQLVRLAVEAIGLPYKNFASHSFRIGAATTAARAGIEDSTIHTLGRWSSSAFLAYICMPRDHLAQFSATLSNS